MSNEERRAQIERMQQKSRDAERRRYWLTGWLPESRLTAQQLTLVLGVAVVVAGVYFFRP